MGHCAPRAGCGGRRQSGRRAYKWCSEPGAPAPTDLITIYRPRREEKLGAQWLFVAPPTPRVSTPLQLPQPRTREGTCSPYTEGHVHRSSKAFKQGRLTSSRYIYKLAKDWGPQDSQSVTFTYMCGPRMVPRRQVVLQGPRDWPGVT